MTEQMPLISIIVPVYNVEKYVDECINSMLSLDSQLVEIVLVNDGSTDTSGNICDYFSRKYDHIYAFHQENQGLSAARNRGIREAKGKFLLFVDSDDYIEAKIVENIINVIRMKPDIEVIFLSGKKVYPNGQQKCLDETYDRNKIVARSQEEVIEYLATLKKYPGSACTKAVRKELIDKCNLFFEEGKTCEDLKWCLQVFLSARKYEIVEGTYYFYRQQREGSITQLYNEEKLLRLMEVIVDFCVLAKSNVKVEKAIYSFMAYEYAIALLIYCYGAKKISEEGYEFSKKFFEEYKFLLLYKKGMGIKIMRYLLGFLGVDLVSKLIGFYYRVKQ